MKYRWICIFFVILRESTPLTISQVTNRFLACTLCLIMHRIMMQYQATKTKPACKFFIRQGNI